MARDDFHAIVYRILSYIYRQLKSGKLLDPTMISPDELDIEPGYWAFILAELKSNGLTDGYVAVRDTNRVWKITKLRDAEITMKGIEYLVDNSFMKRAKDEESGCINI